MKELQLVTNFCSNMERIKALEKSQIKAEDKVFCLCSVNFLQLLVAVAIREACLDFDHKQQLIMLLGPFNQT